ncbi:MAG TPA: tetratricopeptide repeat protein [Blastocatellia bacterium]|nr:tetratricopeptide repeat protein [Blastocatellia bacterium]
MSRKNGKLKIGKTSALAALIAFLSLAVITSNRTIEPAAAKTAAEERAAQIESALFTRAEFFGAQAIIPYPTGEARARLAEVRKLYPQDSEIELKLAELDEKLGDEEQARAEMARYVELEKDSPVSLERLANFHRRSARFADEAAARERMIAAAPRSERAPILRVLIEMARSHRLEKYQRPDFFRGLIASDPGSFEVVKEFVDHLIEQKDYNDALDALRRHKVSFPNEKNYFLEKEVDVLLKLKRGREAEALYVRSFDPFWSDEQSERFYNQFLSERDRLRAYGRELKDSFRRNPANLDTAVRLFHYRHHDYSENDETVSNIFTRVEQARAQRGAKWTADELATVSRLLIGDGKVDQASRFLYTLNQQGALQRGGELRAQVLYELFRLSFNAGTNRTPMTAGDLKFYEDVAKADPHPGALGGVLSLVLADSNPRDEFELEQEAAVGHFNIAAAYRLFNAYKQEYPTSPELAQMYLDLIRHYSTTSEANVAASLLVEFERRYDDAPQYAEVALKLADCYINYGRYAEERALYQRVMDHLGKRRGKDKPLTPIWEAGGGDDLTSQRPATITYPPSAGDTNTEDKEEGYSRLTRISGAALKLRKKADEEGVSYAMVLSRYVASLARENRTAEILALYSSEINKYPDEQGLYEQRLQWLGQTNLVEEQLRVYQEAINRFKTNVWTDRLARWYLRRERKGEFERFSRGLIEKMNDGEIETWLAKFVNSGSSAKSSEFDANLYLSLYTRAHERFSHNLSFVEGLLNHYAARNRWDDWRRLMTEYYFESKSIRDHFLPYLSRERKLREYAETARKVATEVATTRGALAYKLFRADAAAWLCNYEEAVGAYRELNRLYPNTPEFADRLVAFTRSFGQKDQQSLEEAAKIGQAVADSQPASEAYRTQAGEIYAELGDYKRASREWERLIPLRSGDQEIYLDTATIYWDYFQYDDAMRTLASMRRRMNDQTLYAFQMAALLEAKHRTNEAIGEYVKALNENCDDYWRARRRLTTLYARKGVPEQLRLAFQRELGRTKDRESLTLGYVELFKSLDKWNEAAPALRREVARSRSQDFLDRARDHFRESEDAAGELATLRRLVVAAKNMRFAISYQLQLAESAAAKGRKDAASAMLATLVKKYPTNYGVLTEASDFNWRIGRRDQAMRLLQQASQRSRGRFHYVFARKLIRRQIERGQLAAAETALKKLHDENPRNLDVFKELSRVYVRTSRPDALRERYRETIRAIRQSDMDRYEIRDQIEELRASVIDSFTQLRDYKSAVEQHIEIINRDPDDEEKVKAAIQYVKRYGGGDTLIEYYTKASEQAFKDYRWNLALARIYEAKGDFANSTANLRKAIINQPEMIELRIELADICLKAKDYKSAIDALDRARELSNDDPQYLRRLADAYEKAGRKREADAVRAKLPVEKPNTKTLGEQFAEAAALRGKERANAIETYRKAFDAWASDFYKRDLFSSELAGYVETLRDEEPLDQILRRLWDVRARIERDAASKDNLLAGKARALAEMFDRVLPEAVGRVAAEYATGDELAAIDRDVHARMTEAKGLANEDETLVALLNLSQRAGLGQLAEQILIARKDAALAIDKNETGYHDRLMSLVNFYSERGAYRRAAESLEQERARDQWRDKFGYRSMIAEYARLGGDRDAELRALREEFAANMGKPVATTNPMIERYFEALLEQGDAGRDELRRCVQSQTSHRFQLIGFLLRNDELNLAREAVEAAPQSADWKSSRQAEISLAARDLNRDNEAFFLRALNWKTIGEMVASKPDQNQHLIGDNWFYLAEGYGRWLAASEKAKQTSKAASAAFLPALIENRPKDPGAQRRLALWYADQGAHQLSLEHFQLALEMNPGDEQTIADIGSAYFKLGKRQDADEYWSKIIAGDKPGIESLTLYLRTLGGHGLAADARARLKPLVLKRFNDAGLSGEEVESLKPLIRALARSFGKESVKEGPKESEDGVVASSKDEAEKAAFLRGLCDSAPSRFSLAEIVVNEPLVKREHFALFYEKLIRDAKGIPQYESDADFVDRLRRRASWSLDEVEESLDHERAAQPATGAGAQDSSRFGARIGWRQKYLDYLIAEDRNAEALGLIPKIEQEFKGLYARPEWLRLAKLRLDVRQGRVTQAVAGLKRFAGIEASPKLESVATPNIERLNTVAATLRAEKRDAEADQLLQAAYERDLALEQLQTSSFAGLARMDFEKGDVGRGAKLLKLMVELGDTETRETAAAEVAALDWVKARAVTAESIERPQPSNQIQLAEALRVAAETAAEFDQFAVAIEYRRRLSALSPEENVNRLELARALAAGGKTDEATNQLASLISDRRVARQIRWTAVWIAPEVVKSEGRPEGWTSLDQQLRAIKDQEMVAAVEAQSMLSQGQGQSDNALKRLDGAVTGSPSAQLKLFRALSQKNAGRESEALQSLLNSMIAFGDAWIAAPFGATEDEQRWQVIRLYAKQGLPRAALKMADADERLKGQPAIAGDERIDRAKTRLISLSELSSHRLSQSQLEMLGLLSISAEQIGELEKAIEFETARLNMSPDPAERRKSESRIEQLKTKQKERKRKTPLPIEFNENAVTRS